LTVAIDTPLVIVSATKLALSFKFAGVKVIVALVRLELPIA